MSDLPVSFAVFRAYRRVQCEGLTNMMDVKRVVQLSNYEITSGDQVLACMRHYDALYKAYYPEAAAARETDIKRWIARSVASSASPPPPPPASLTQVAEAITDSSGEESSSSSSSSHSLPLPPRRAPRRGVRKPQMPPLKPISARRMMPPEMLAHLERLLSNATATVSAE